MVMTGIGQYAPAQCCTYVPAMPHPVPNHTGIVRMRTTQYGSSQYDTGVAAWPRTVQYRCRRLAAHRTGQYGILPQAVNRSQIILE